MNSLATIKSKKQRQKQNIMNFARKYYTESPLHFEQDYLTIKYLKVQLNKFINNKKINLRLVLNYIITLNNVFISPKILAKILFVECEKETWGVLATFLYFLRISPKILIIDENTAIEVENIIDWGLYKKLDEL